MVKCTNCKDHFPKEDIGFWHGKNVCKRCWNKLNYFRKLKNENNKKESGKKL